MVIGPGLALAAAPNFLCKELYIAYRVIPLSPEETFSPQDCPLRLRQRAFFLRQPPFALRRNLASRKKFFAFWTVSSDFLEYLFLLIHQQPFDQFPLRYAVTAC